MICNRQILVALIAIGLAPSLTSAKPIDFNRDVRPILAGKCFACHGPDARVREADLRLDVRSSALAVIRPGNPAKSELLERVSHSDLDLVMPPRSTGKQVTKREAAILREWIRQGAPYEDHWAFVPPAITEPPPVENSQWAGNGIDRFVLTHLQKEGLEPSPAAGKATLIRRVTLDLTGLPPAPEEIREFLGDNSPDAYEKLVDRLLASPRYGEHMAGDWLDAARYADTDGYQNDRYRHMHPWRDWVIFAFNENLPFDQFVIEQLAGDMLPNPTLEQQIATGFCRNHRINSEDGSIPAEWHVENVVDRVDTLGTVFLGLTVGCARCHDHKYDPISQTEYYRLFAYFNNVPEWGIGPNNGNSPPFITVPESWPNVSPEENHALTPAPLKLRRAREEAGNGLQRPQPGGPETVMVMQEMETPRPTYRLLRGQYNMPDESELLTPGVPDRLNTVPGPMPANRLELAKWLVHPKNPLTARVTVNRYWQRFFGVGLVKTSENFGTQGELPSHPELLDWLAMEFVRSGWDIKAIQKRIVTSATYCQSSVVTPELLRRDPENRLFARGPRFRLPAFVLRDQALAASGLLVESLGGRSVKPYMPPKIWEQISNNKYQQDHGANLYRRSVYTYWRRTIPPPTMRNFNSGDREVCTVRTERTNTPLQALTLLNNMTFVESARFLAERMIQGGGETPEARLTYGFQLMTGRPPQEEELALLASAHQAMTAKYNDHPDQAEQLIAVGERPRDASLDPIEHAAFTMIASLILNLDESITKE